MKLNVCIITMFFVFSLQVFANDLSEANSLTKDVQEALETVFAEPSYNRRSKRNSEIRRLIEKHGIELIEPMKKLATDSDSMKRFIALKTLARLGKSDSVKQAFMDLAKNSSYDLRRESIYMLAELDKGFAKDVTINAITATTDKNHYFKASIIPLLGVLGDPNTVVILSDVENVASQKYDIKKAARQTREYLEYRLNLPEATRKLWEDQAYAYLLKPREVELRGYRGIRIEYSMKADFLAKCGYGFSIDFLRYHLDQKDPLAAALIGIQKEKAAIEDLERCLNESAGKKSTFSDLCLNSLNIITGNVIDNSDGRRYEPGIPIPYLMDSKK